LVLCLHVKNSKIIVYIQDICTLVDVSCSKAVQLVFKCKLLDDYGFSNVFTTVNSDVLQTFPLLFKQRVIDCFLQEWQGYVDRSAVLEEYKL